MKKIVVNIISGFLGSGKTTVIDRLLQRKPPDENWAIIINEFGQAAIDFQTIQKAKNNVPVFEVAGGCICCSSKDYFEEHLKSIVENYSPDRILIEPTGLGGIQMVEEIICEFPELQLQATICLVDVQSEGNIRLRINQIYLSQIRESDIIVISKCDLEPEKNNSAKLLRWIKKEFNPKIRYAQIKNGNLNLKLLEIKKVDHPSPTNKYIQLFPQKLIENYFSKTFLFKKKETFDAVQLEKLFIKNKSVIRAKGFVHTLDNWKHFNYTDGSFNLSQISEKPENALVIIATHSIPDNFISSKLFLKQSN